MADNLYNEPLTIFRTMISESAIFQTWTGNVGDATATLDHIFVWGYGDPAAVTWPLVSLLLAPDFRRTSIGGGPPRYYVSNGSLILMFEDNVNEVTYPTVRARIEYVMGQVGQTMHDLEQIADENLPFDHIPLTPEEGHVSKLQKRVFAGVQIEIGV